MTRKEREQPAHQLTWRAAVTIVVPKKYSAINSKRKNDEGGKNITVVVAQSTKLTLAAAANLVRDEKRENVTFIREEEVNRFEPLRSYKTLVVRTECICKIMSPSGGQK